MLDFPKTKQEYYETQSKDQLIIFLNNQDYTESTLRDKLFLLGGCHNFGGCDGTDGACVECYYNNQALFDRCSYFADAYIKYRKRLREGNSNEFSQR